jgi:hypothetical protein
MRTSTKRLVLAAGFLGVLVGAVPMVLAQSGNSEIGTWTLNLAKSTYPQGAAPKSGTVRFEAAGAGVKVTVDQVDAAGTARHWTYTANYDGKDSPIVGNNANADTVARTRVNATTVKSVNKKGGKVTTTLTTVISPDGKTRTNTTTGTDGMGMAVSSVAVYDRQ